MKLFIDVDNTILEHYSFYSNQTENRTHTTIGKYPEANKQAIATMYQSSICRDPEKVRELFLKDNVYILTKYPHLDYENHKRKRLCEILRISVDELLNLKDTKGNLKYIYLEDAYSKVQKVKDIFKLETMKDCILVDDYSQNIIEWEVNLGIGIKYFNEYNSPNHPTNGLAVSNFKFLSYFGSDYKVENLFLSANNKYKSKIFLDKLMLTKFNINEINMLKVVYDEIAMHLDIKNNMSNNKYNYLNFIAEYYKFRDNIDPLYWPIFFKEKLVENTFNVYLANFEINLKNHVRTVFENEHYISLKIIDSSKSQIQNVYDVYLTIEDNSFLEDVDHIFDKSIEFLLKIFN